MGTRKTSPARQLPAVSAWQRILRELQARTAPSKPRSIKAGASLQEMAGQLRLRQTPRFFGLIPEQAALLARFFPDAYRLTLEQADQIKQHRFDLPGLGVVTLGREIDWNTDPHSKFTWPMQHLSHLATNHSKTSDPRIPWELSRFYHLVRLGQAYLYTQDESYAEEIVSQISHWIKANPNGFGINWADARTAAIRVVNWIWAYYSILESDALTKDFLALWLASLREHGEYLIKSLERRKPYSSRLIVSLAGLAYLGILSPEFPESVRWKNTGLTKLWQQLEEQVLPDGLYYDLSTGEQRFVTEAALSVAGLCIVNGIEVPEAAQARMRAMLDVIMTWTQFDGLTPMLGDSVDNRLHDLSVFSDPIRKIWDHRHLLALGSLVLERQLSEWAGFIEPSARGWSIAAGDEWQDAFWCFASDAAARFTDVITRVVARPDDVNEDTWVDVKPGVRLRARALARKPISMADVTTSHGFEASSLYVMRHQDFQLTVAAGDRTRGTYRHHDALSITLSGYGRSFIIDPGTYVHDAGSVEAARLRDVASHNVLYISANDSAHVREHVQPKAGSHGAVHRWVSQPKYDFLDASLEWHAGPGSALIYRRQIWFDKTTHLWVLHDQIRPAEPKGAKPGEVALAFHFEDVPLNLDRTHAAFYTNDPNQPNLIILPMGDFKLKPVIEGALLSRRYGVKTMAPVAKYSGELNVPADLIVMLYPFRGEMDFKVVRAAGRTALLSFKKALTSLYGVDTQVGKAGARTP